MHIEAPQNISGLSVVYNMQLVSLMVKVVQLSGVKIQSTSYGMRRKAEGKGEVYITNSHASMKLVLWEDFINKLTRRESYQFNSKNRQTNTSSFSQHTNKFWMYN